MAKSGGKKKGMQDTVKDSDFGASAAFHATATPASIKSAAPAGPTGGLAKVKHDDR